MNSNIDFQSVCLGTILYSSTEIIDFSWQLYFFLVNFKSEIWQIYVIRRHHCQSTRRSYLPLLIFSYKGISILYYSMTKSNFRVYASSTSSSIERKCPCMKKFKGEGNCGINTYSVYINKENLSWFFDLHYIFITRGRVLRKKTSNSEDLKNMRDNYNHKYKALM